MGGWFSEGLGGPSDADYGSEYVDEEMARILGLYKV
jgi:hypothetical protein